MLLKYKLNNNIYTLYYQNQDINPQFYIDFDKLFL